MLPEYTEWFSILLFCSSLYPTGISACFCWKGVRLQLCDWLLPLKQPLGGDQDADVLDAAAVGVVQALGQVSLQERLDLLLGLPTLTATPHTPFSLDTHWAEAHGNWTQTKIKCHQVERRSFNVEPLNKINVKPLSPEQIQLTSFKESPQNCEKYKWGEY